MKNGKIDLSKLVKSLESVYVLAEDVESKAKECISQGN